MRESVVLTVIGLAFLAYGFVPRVWNGSREEIETASASNSDNSNTATDLDYAAWVAGKTELSRAADGHFYADAIINNSQISFLIDTGASVVALTGSDARTAGFHWSAADIRPIGRGASGPVLGLTITLDLVSVHGHEARDVSAVIIPEGLDRSLLGQSFLSTVQPIRIEHDRMTFGG